MDIKERRLNQFRETMKFIMRNELLFTNRVVPKAFALLRPKDDDGDGDTHIGMRGIYEDEQEIIINTLDEGKTKISLTSIVEDYKASVIADGHDVLSMCIIDVYEIPNDSHYVFVMYNDYNEDDTFGKTIEIHKLVRGESVIDKDGDVAQTRSKLTFNHA